MAVKALVRGPTAAGSDGGQGLRRLDADIGIHIPQRLDQRRNGRRRLGASLQQRRDRLAAITAVGALQSLNPGANLLAQDGRVLGRGVLRLLFFRFFLAGVAARLDQLQGLGGGIADGGVLVVGGHATEGGADLVGIDANLAQGLGRVRADTGVLVVFDGLDKPGDGGPGGWPDLGQGVGRRPAQRHVLVREQLGQRRHRGFGGPAHLPQGHDGPPAHHGIGVEQAIEEDVDGGVAGLAQRGRGHLAYHRIVVLHGLAQRLHGASRGLAHLGQDGRRLAADDWVGAGQAGAEHAHGFLAVAGHPPQGLGGTQPNLGIGIAESVAQGRGRVPRGRAHQSQRRQHPQTHVAIAGAQTR